jgi:hypothetical protein
MLMQEESNYLFLPDLPTSKAVVTIPAGTKVKL